jgi:hypothetical protein
VALFSLASGDLDALEDVLDHATSSQVMAHRGGEHLLFFLPCLLPLPAEFGYSRVWGRQTPRMDNMDWIIENREIIRQWFRRNKAALYWDAEGERYRLGGSATDLRETE